MQWKRAHLLWGSMIMQCLLLGIWEFSYSSTFATHVYIFIVGFKVSQVNVDTLAAISPVQRLSDSCGFQDNNVLIQPP